MEGSEMKTTVNHPTEARAAGTSNRPMQNRVLFAATCPQCRQQVLQHGYSRVVLFAYLDAEHEIEAYCGACDEFWPICAEERRGIVGVLLPGPI